MGRPWPAPGEPLFLPEDTDGALALELEEANLGPCGQPHDEAMHPDAEGNYRVRRVACHACAEKSKAQQDLHEAPSDHGIYLVVEKTTPDRTGGPS